MRTLQAAAEITGVDAQVGAAEVVASPALLEGDAKFFFGALDLHVDLAAYVTDAEADVRWHDAAIDCDVLEVFEVVNRRSAARTSGDRQPFDVGRCAGSAASGRFDATEAERLVVVDDVGQPVGIDACWLIEGIMLMTL